MAKKKKNKLIIPEVVSFPTISDKKLYFDNNRVEDLLLKYLFTECTDVELRDQIMAHAEELIRQIIRAHGLHKIYPGYEESAFGDLFQTAWAQVERVLYKYKAQPYCADCYDNRRPKASVLYEPDEDEYGVLTPEDIARMRLKCPRCKKQPTRVVYRGMSKVFNMWCVSPDTMMFTTDGINTIQNVVNRDGYSDRQEIWTLGLGDPRRIIAGVSKALEQPVRTIKTECGYSMTCTHPHGLYGVYDGRMGWNTAGEIKIGDLIGLQYNHQFYVGNDDISDIELSENGDWNNKPSVITVELAYLLGLYVAEGSYTDGQLSIYNTDDDVINFLQNNNNLGLKFTHRKEEQVLYTCNKRFIELIKKMGFTRCRAHEKFIPQRILKCSKPILNSFISGLFDGDGHSSRHNGSVGFTSTSKRLIDQVRMLLLNAGILTKLFIDKREISHFNRRGKNYTSRKRPAYQLMCAIESSRVFYDEIGFSIARKQNKRKHLAEARCEIYGLNDKFRALHAKYGCGSLGYNKIRTTIIPGRNVGVVDVMKEKLKSWCEYCDDVDYRYIEERLCERTKDGIKTIWLPVVSISESTSKVCEVSVESDDHSYIANGFISHNSQISKTVILAFIKKESRDYKNSESYKTYLDSKYRISGESGIVKRFLSEANEVFEYNDVHLTILNALSKIIEKDDRPHEGMITKLVNETGLPRSQIAGFLEMVRMRSGEFTDSPINDRPKHRDARRKDSQHEDD